MMRFLKSLFGTQLEKVPSAEQDIPSIDDNTVLKLCDYGLAVEEFYESPQDIEWASDSSGTLYILQSRPLNLPEIEVQGSTVRGSLNGESVIAYDAGRPLKGFAGLWTKSYSVTWFDKLILNTREGKEVVAF